MPYRRAEHVTEIEHDLWPGEVRAGPVDHGVQRRAAVRRRPLAREHAVLDRDRGVGLLKVESGREHVMSAPHRPISSAGRRGWHPALVYARAHPDFF